MEKKYNILLDSMPSKAEINGNIYEINTDFRNVLAYLRLVKSEQTDEEKATFTISLFFGDQIRMDDVPELMQWLQWYLTKGEKQEEKEEKNLFDLIVDSNRVYAAFWQTYGINLRKVKMHWWTFSVLLEGLPAGTHLSDVINIRGRKFEKWMKPADRNELQRLKDRYRIGEKQDLMGSIFASLRGLFK